MTAMVMTVGTNTPDTLSATFAIGALVAAASRNHLDDLGESRILADPGCLAAQEAGLIDRCGGNAVAGGLVHRNTLAGQRGFVHSAVRLPEPRRPPGCFRPDERRIRRRVLYLLNRHSALPDRSEAASRSSGPASSGSLSASVVLPLERASSILPTVIRVRIMAADSK